MVVVDTNILVYAADADSQWHVKSRDWIEERRSRPDAWYVTWPILYEFVRDTTLACGSRGALAGAWSFVSTLLATPGLGVLVPTERHAAVAAQLVAELRWSPAISFTMRIRRPDARARHTRDRTRRRGLPALSAVLERRSALQSRPDSAGRGHGSAPRLASATCAQRRAQRLENWKLARALRWPYFLRSTTRESRVRKPPFLSAGRAPARNRSAPWRGRGARRPPGRRGRRRSPSPSGRTG